MRVFGPENHDTVTTKCALYASRLLKKPDQCLAVQLCSHLFWAVPTSRDNASTQLYRDGKRVLECLQKSLKIADTCMEQSMNVQLFVEILNRYLYYFEQKNEAVIKKPCFLWKFFLIKKKKNAWILDRAQVHQRPR